MDTGEHEYRGTWVLGNMDTGEHGYWGAWKLGNIGTGENGHWGPWILRNMETEEDGDYSSGALSLNNNKYKGGDTITNEFFFILKSTFFLSEIEGKKTKKKLFSQHAENTN